MLPTTAVAVAVNITPDLDLGFVSILSASSELLFSFLLATVGISLTYGCSDLGLVIGRLNEDGFVAAAFDTRLCCRNFAVADMEATTLPPGSALSAPSNFRVRR
mmetsp:Transcript_19579/g.25681  ORF Transcript_19579/g.25681 Transcript_19579/m.25681 type:complete len:104 (+) Transcript_19579:465-776(+)